MTRPLVFRALNKDDMKQIVGLMTKELAKRCETQLGITLVVRDAAKQYIVDKAYDPKYGADRCGARFRMKLRIRLRKNFSTEASAGATK